MHGNRPDAFLYSFEEGVLTIDSGENHVRAEVGRTHLWVNGEEKLMVTSVIGGA